MPRNKNLHKKIFSKTLYDDDIKKGLLWYDNDYMYTRKNTKEPFKKIKRGPNIDGAEHLEHEKRANKKT